MPEISLPICIAVGPPQGGPYLPARKVMLTDTSVIDYSGNPVKPIMGAALASVMCFLSWYLAVYWPRNTMIKEDCTPQFESFRCEPRVPCLTFYFWFLTSFFHGLDGFQGTGQRTGLAKGSHQQSTVNEETTCRRRFEEKIRRTIDQSQ